MSEEKEAEQEPSIEEILDSIRQIISDDDEEEAVTADGQAEPEAEAEEPPSEPEPEPQPEVIEKPEPEPEIEEPEAEDFATELDAIEQQVDDSDDDDVLELTDKVEDMDIAFEEHVEEPEPEPDASLDFTDDMDEGVFAEPDDGMLDSPEYAPEEDDADTLLTQKAEEAALGAFKHLATKTAIDRVGSLTIEDIVRDELRPMLKDWLDSNFPRLVERLVREELDRITRRALDED